MRQISATTHEFQHSLEWGWPPTPEWFDHHVGAQVSADARPHTIQEERGVFTNLAVPEGGRVLDLCCGDGYYSRYFYAHRAHKVIGVDFDPEPIEYARRVNGSEKITFEIADIRESMPEGPFNTVIWNAAIEHFTEEEVTKVLEDVRDRLSPGGVLTGDTIVSRADGKQLEHHEREYSGPADLLAVLSEAFEHVYVWASPFPGRTELYFYASDTSSAIPFSPESGLIEKV